MLMKSELLSSALGLCLALAAPAYAGSTTPQDHKPAAKDDQGKTAVKAEPAKAAAKNGHGDEEEEEEDVASTSDGHGTPAKSAKDAGPGSVHWAYEGKEGPEQWGGLSKDFQVCKSGKMQSPIDLTETKAEGATIHPISFDYRLTELNVVHNGHTIQVNYAPGSGITVKGKRYELLQLHFHTPSEHAIDGKRAPMEAHFVHKAADGSLAVVGVMMEEGASNLALGEIWNSMPTKAGETETNKKVLINARDLLPHDTSYYRYMGSLTTPPCTEGVNWHVLKEPIQVDAQQIDQFADAVGDNSRPLQALNTRFLLVPFAAH